MNKKKLLMCYHSAEFGGVEKQILDIINGLSSKLDIIVVCPDGPMVKGYLDGGAIKHVALSPRSEADLQYSLQIRRLIISENIDIVHAHELKTGALAIFGAWLASFNKNIQRVYHVHTPFSWWKHNSIKKIPALVINTIVNAIVGNFFATDVLALTLFIKKQRIFKEFIFPYKIRVIPNGIDLNLFKYSKSKRDIYRKKLNIPSNSFVIGNMARFTKEKGQEILIRAFSEILKNKKEDAFLLLAGGGILVEDMKLLAKKLDVDNRVIFTDKFSEEDKLGYLSCMDLFVFPSYAEGFGIAILESMAMNIPTIASNLPVLEDVGGKAISYAKVGDVSDFVAKMGAAMWAAPDVPSGAAHIRAKLFSMQRFLRNYSSLYSI